ncbi:MAG: hypothetical protein ABEK16_03660 [Candidatus Nanohalobium sp.]
MKLEIKRERGALEYIPGIIVLGISILLILLSAPVIAEIELNADLRANRIQNVLKFQAHTATAAIHSNRELMKKAGKYNLSGSDISEKQITDPLNSALSPFKRYYAEVQSQTDEGSKILLNTSSSNKGGMRYSSVRIASPSENLRKLKIGVFSH